jgi:hypothetical protein
MKKKSKLSFIGFILKFKFHVLKYHMIIWLKINISIAPPKRHEH